jgi:hypothetical protein
MLAFSSRVPENSYRCCMPNHRKYSRMKALAQSDNGEVKITGAGSEAG